MQVVVSLAIANAGPDASLCEGSSTQLNASGGGGYTWSPSTALSDPNVADPVASPITTTDYVVTVTNADQCIDTDTMTVTVNALANAGLDELATTCGSGVIFSLTDSLGGTPDAGGQWYTSNFVPHGDQFDPSNDQTGTYYYIAGGGTACPDTASVQVTISNPAITITGDNVICIGDTTQLSNSGNAIYLWTPATDISDPAIGDPLFFPTTTTVYTLTVTDTAGCIGSSDITITVLSLIHI